MKILNKMQMLHFLLKLCHSALPAKTKQGPRKSPSTLKRNDKRKQEFLMRELAWNPTRHLLRKKKHFSALQCDHCEVKFKTRNGLKIHSGKRHKEAARSLEKLCGELPPKQPLTVVVNVYLY